MKPNADILEAFNSIPRSSFVASTSDDRIHGHSLPTRSWTEYALQRIGLTHGQRVLHIGTGSGYIPALLSKIARQVITIEKDPGQARAAESKFQELELPNIKVIVGDGEDGASREGPFDLIFVSTSSIQHVTKLLSQLKARGQLFVIEEEPSEEEMIVNYHFGPGRKAVREEVCILPQIHDINRVLMNLDCVDEEILNSALNIARSEKKPLIEIVRRLVDIDESEFYRNVASESGMHYREMEGLLADLDPEFFSKFSRAFLDLLHIIPIYCKSGSILIATYDPGANVSDIKKLYPHHTIDVVIVSMTSFRRLWSMLELALQGELKVLDDFKESVAETAGKEDLSEHHNTQVEAHLVSVLEAILLDAASEKASDIHIEQYNGKFRLRLRIDGELREFNRYQLSQHEINGLVNVIKIRADMDIAEKRIPQGGRSHMVVGKTQYDLRIQVQPSLHGEYVVIRLLPQTGKVITIEELGLSDEIANTYHRLLQNPSGMVLVVGPTGSGKSTTLYAGLQVLAREKGRKVITVEDPIEYDILNIQQTQVNPEIGFHFCDAMRSFVRLDPDVIFIGEIRDHETAQEALRASQTGHLVLSTLHCNDATDAQQRLFDLEVHPNSISSELTAIIAQRLAKRVCPHCKIEVTPDASIMRELFPKEVPSGFRTYAGQGCDHCHNRGTVGRVAVIEFLQVNDAIKEAISRKASALEVRTIALENGLITMRDSALEHVNNGIIPLSEIPRILSADRMAPERHGSTHRLRAI